MDIIQLEEKIKKLERQIKIKDSYLDLIWMIGYDYDGCNTVDSLKDLIDELTDLALKAKKNDDKSVMYNGGDWGEPLNILFEKL